MRFTETVLFILLCVLPLKAEPVKLESSTKGRINPPLYGCTISETEVLTCYHNLLNFPAQFYSTRVGNSVYWLKPARHYPKHDLAVLKLTRGKFNHYYKFEENYFGRLTNFGPATLTGTHYSEDGNAAFIFNEYGQNSLLLLRFQPQSGKVVPGHSGSPVIKNGRLVGVMQRYGPNCGYFLPVKAFPVGIESPFLVELTW